MNWKAFWATVGSVLGIVGFIVLCSVSSLALHILTWVFLAGVVALIAFGLYTTFDEWYRLR